MNIPPTKHTKYDTSIIVDKIKAAKIMIRVLNVSACTLKIHPLKPLQQHETDIGTVYSKNNVFAELSYKADFITKGGQWRKVIQNGTKSEFPKPTENEVYEDRNRVQHEINSVLIADYYNYVYLTIFLYILIILGFYLVTSFYRMKNPKSFGKSDLSQNMLYQNILCLMVALLMIVLGISVYSEYHNFTYFYESAKSGKFFSPSILSVLLGLVLLVVTSFGFFGSLKLSTCLVNLYAIILAVILVGKLIVVIVTFTIDPNTISQWIKIPVQGYGDDPEIRDEIDQLQVALNCCGSSSFLDYRYMYFPDNYNVVALNKEVNGELITMTVPESCCSSVGDTICNKLRSTSCSDALVNLIVQNASVLGVLGVSVMFIQLLGVIFALLLARCIRKVKSERALMNWKVKEQMILAREANCRQQTMYVGHEESSVA